MLEPSRKRSESGRTAAVPRFPASTLFSANGDTIEYVTAGSGKPAVVLINGSGGPIEGWYRVFEALSGATTTFAYNRPGLGRSTKPLRPQTAGVMVEDLRALLLAVGVPQPWVLVGHSFGGLVANLFARLHSQEVAGVVMLEATAPEDVLLLKRHENAMQRGLAWLAAFVTPLNPNHETLHASQSVTEIAGAPAFPPLPLKVITGTKPAMAWATSQELLALRAKHQKMLAGLSPLGVQLEASRSGHFPQLTEPELVTAAIRELVAAMPYQLEELRIQLTEAVRQAAAELRSEKSELSGFALCTDDDVRTLYHVACTRDWVREQEGDYADIGFIYVEWTHSADDAPFEAISRQFARLAEANYASDAEWSTARDQRFNLLVSALRECREADVFTPDTLLCAGSTDPSEHLEALAMRGVEALNAEDVADQFARALGYEEHRTPARGRRPERNFLRKLDRP